MSCEGRKEAHNCRRSFGKREAGKLMEIILWIRNAITN
jgi:hypothetical protein